MVENQVGNETVQAAPRRLPLWVLILAFGGLIVFLTLIGLGMKRTQQGPIGIGDKVPSFNLQTFDGQTINTANMGDKVIVVNFWASWCVPCESEAADLQKAWEYYQPGGKVVFLGADYVDTEPEAKAYLAKFQITYPNAPDLGTRVSQMFRIQGVPETYFIGKDGRLAFKQWGPFNSMSEIQAVIDPLLQ